MTPDQLRWEQECRSLVRYLLGIEATAYTIRKYCDYHQRAERRAGTGFEGFLTASAASGGLRLWLADLYTARLHKTSELRRKMVLTLALLECSSPSAKMIDQPEVSGNAKALATLAVGGAMSVCGMIAAAALLLPVRAWYGLRGGGASD